MRVTYIEETAKRGIPSPFGNHGFHTIKSVYQETSVRYPWTRAPAFRTRSAIVNAKKIIFHLSSSLFVWLTLIKNRHGVSGKYTSFQPPLSNPNLAALPYTVSHFRISSSFTFMAAFPVARRITCLRTGTLDGRVLREFQTRFSSSNRVT